MTSVKPVGIAVGPQAVQESTRPAREPAALIMPEARATFLAQLDDLWGNAKYAAIVKHINDYIRPFVSADMKGLGLDAIISLNEELFVLQHRLIAVSNKLSLVEDRPAAERALKLQQKISYVRTYAFRAAVALFDKSIPDPVAPWITYRNTLKKPGFHSPGLQESYYLDKAREFIRKGGDFEQIQPVSAEFIATLKSGELAEWVVDAHDEARICKSDVPVAPNHTLLARDGRK
jgi:hypothetical protein